MLPDPDREVTSPSTKPDSSPAHQILHTPAEAARLLSVKESWLRRAAGRRLIPSTRLGKHLRFSAGDLQAIVMDGARPSCASSPSARHHGRNHADYP
ncbi:helix-turn-helix domain-containing protein [Actinoalloteichus caeruleus]|uniref:helix-turn-helix domain-containing protein n=1 Tax=Actinoalloteichus cyanogriseus TaxID=2893586 RepID=UPI003AADE5BD